MLDLRYGARQSGLFLCNHMPLLDEFAHDFTLVMDIHEDQNVGHQMPILDDLALLVARVGSNGGGSVGIRVKSSHISPKAHATDSFDKSKGPGIIFISKIYWPKRLICSVM